jgi:hypothetical protein
VILKKKLLHLTEEEDTWLSRLSLSLLDELIWQEEDEYQKEDTLLKSTRNSLEETKKLLFDSQRFAEPGFCCARVGLQDQEGGGFTEVCRRTR